MAFDEVKFPDSLAYGSKGGPSYHTTVAHLEGGAEKRMAHWSLPRYRFELATHLQSEAQLQELLAFFHARQGRARGFRFKDWSDYSLNDEVIGEGNGSTTLFQITKTYESGGQQLVRPISKIVAGSLVVSLDGVEQTSGFTVDLAQGRVTFSSAPATGVAISVEGEFDVPVRFDMDHLPLTLESSGKYRYPAISLVELR